MFLKKFSPSLYQTVEQPEKLSPQEEPYYIFIIFAMMKRTALIITLLAGSLFLAGCGYRAPLYQSYIPEVKDTTVYPGVRPAYKELAALLEKVSGDLGHLRQVGERAMEELYLSWQDCVARAYEQYQLILEKKEQGLLPARRKLPADYLVRLTARTMEERARRRRVYRELFRDFRETAVGMMENIQEAEETAEHFLDQLSADLHRGIGKGRKG